MIHNKIIYTPFSDWRFNLTKAEGDYIWDDKGNKYIDFTSGWNVTNLGWNHHEIIEAGIKQLEKNSYVPMWAADDAQLEYAENLTLALGNGLNAIGRANGGVEAVEMALKVARVYTGKKKIISFYEQFHGSTTQALELSYREDWLANFATVNPDIVHLDYPHTFRSNKPEAELLEEFSNNLEILLAKDDVAAVITEAGIITGWGSTYLAPKGFIEKVRELTKKYSALLILDEVGTGFSRIGSLFAMHQFKVSPDIVTLAKGISNGSAPISAVVMTDEIAEKTFAGANLQSTFGWNPVACAIANKTLEIHQRDKVWEMSAKKGEYLMNKLKTELSEHPNVGDIRGMGLEIGLDLVIDKKANQPNHELGKKVVEQAFTLGLHLVEDEGNIQIMPPLTINNDVLDKGLEILIKILKNGK